MDGQNRHAEKQLTRYLQRHPPRLVAVWRQAAPDVCPYHDHATFEAVYHFRGRGVTGARAGGRTHFDVGWTVLYPPGLAHNQVMQAPGIDICMHWALDAPLPVPLRRCLAAPPAADSDIERECLAMLETEADTRELSRLSRQHRGVALFASLAGDALRSTAPQPAKQPPEAHAQRAYRYITTHFHEADRIETVAQHVGVSPDYLRHVFKAKYGVSLKQAITRARIEHAKRLLAYSPLPQKTIAVECGFANERHLSSTFRSAVGLTPGNYRRRFGQRHT